MQRFRIPFAAMASGCEIVLCAPDSAHAHLVAGTAIDEVRRIERKYSRYLDGSIVSRINVAAGEDWIECDPETLSLLDFADSLHRSSAGLFDITSGLLRRAWDFKRARVPDAQTLADLQPLIGWEQVERSGSKLRLARRGMEIDFGGFGKEYAADRAALQLAQSGIQHGYVNLAGDMRILGPKPDGKPWLMGIQDPRRKDGIFATIPVASGGLATSGDYERYFEIDGKRYCHILNPHTGYPVTHWRSISVMAPLAIVAGGCSTIAMLMEQRALEFLEATGYSYLAIDCEGEIHQRKSSALP